MPTFHNNYARSQLKPKIVHIGFGAFHRAHQALFADELASVTDSDWGYCEVNLFGGEQLIEDLRNQQHLFTVIEKGPQGPKVKTVGSVCESFHLTFDGHEAIINKIADPETKIVSITITEKGYGIDLHTERLDINHPFIKTDLDNFDQPKSAVGCIVQGLKRRMENHLAPISIMSCDNMPENGKKTHHAIVDFAHHVNPALAGWIEENISFPSTMVDRIVPALTEAAQQEVDELVGEHDPCGIICEPFRQWVIEDNFVSGRPEWEKVGVELVADVLPFEEMKLRMLNGSHSFLAYLGYLSGYEHIADCMQDPQLKLAAYHLMLQEQAPTLSMPDGVDLAQYADCLIDRYCNPNIKHRTWQIAMDGSQKLPQRLLESATWHIHHNRPFPHIALAVAAWIKYVGAVDEQGQAIDVRDPIADMLYQRFHSSSNEVARVQSLLDITSVFGSELPTNYDFVESVIQAYQRLELVGAKQAVSELIQ
ncbi:mannitol dehydrogenase family protein [Vibrio spartinae]|uniref:Polyol:NADP oxidoreductase n=1 Tax=Vibrio spartinae TaxID=1918945 RepID=A0A1N6M907_9VIBR|nr:fructuronate reductase [Vibrio spartinae]QMV16198.1 Polyol:NADP oxidoreductase [Vibrio spartinae]SIO95935.1 Polyol:NADP oxidoreductase [Vibrio spartinae]